MDHDDDVEHLFSWLQTPELRYREFAGAREITDNVVIREVRPRPGETPIAPASNPQLQEEYPPNQFPDQRDAPEDVVVHSEHAAPTPSAAPAPLVPPAVPPIPASPPQAAPQGPFALGASGRNNLRRPQYEEPVPQAQPVMPSPTVPPVMGPPQAAPAAPPPAAPPTVMPPTVMPPTVMPPPEPPAPPPTARPAAPAVGRLLGGAYRENGTNGGAPEAPVPPPPSPQRTEHSLDAVFGRLAGGRGRLPDPRERMRHIPGLGPPPNRTR
jgi:hypothetical protein